MSEVKCSTCKGEKTLTFEQGQRCVPCVTCSGSGIDWRKTCDVAQSQLAALREELADIGAYNDQLNDQCESMQQRLADAERRNAELTDLIRMTLDNSSEDAQTGEIGIERGDYDELCSFIKPTESGASE